MIGEPFGGPLSSGLADPWFDRMDRMSFVERGLPGPGPRAGKPPRPGPPRIARRSPT